MQGLSSDPPGVLIIIPVLNETEHIRELMLGIDERFPPGDYVLCLIDDGSTDGTVERIKQLTERVRGHIHLIQRTKAGRGSQRGSALLAGVRWGLENTRCDVFIEMDGDLSHRVVELKTGIHYVREHGYDVAVASKFTLGGQVLNRPMGRRLISRVSSSLVGLLLTFRVRDYSNGYRFYTRQAAEAIARHAIRYGSPIYLTEVMALWLRNHLRVMEFPSIYIGRNEGLSKLRYVDLAKALFAVFEISYRYHFGGFEKTSSAEVVVEAPADLGLGERTEPPG